MNNQPNVPRLALRPEEAAECLGVSPRTLWELTKPRGPIPFKRIGKRSIRYSVRDLESYLESLECDGDDLQSDCGRDRLNGRG
jgi:excisionase family DNA binding protein